MLCVCLVFDCFRCVCVLCVCVCMHMCTCVCIEVHVYVCLCILVCMYMYVSNICLYYGVACVMCLHKVLLLAVLFPCSHVTVQGSYQRLSMRELLS